MPIYYQLKNIATIGKKNMKRIPILAMIAVAGCIGLAIEAKAQTASSSNSGSVTANCSVTASAGTLVGTTNIINGGNFPTELTSNASPGRFTTLCNTASSGISIELTNFSKSNPTTQGGGPYTVTYSLSANSPSAYVGNTILGTDISDAAPQTGSIGHAFSSTASELIVSGKIKSTPGKILGKGNYSIAITATLTP
jgi:hypothetical protein